ncbi:sugar ABC transporter substrate-binding protein [Cellulomonas gilvus]|uniref:Extracellular solute-binding protein family 1 n=1 Tax=Cellulomonas gilvus (strain ATCC 13127 / NRRL B-14078) TaxID=593907 RepID=F8A1Z1_CELGA|nr:maltose ABC transporter substrate-binding protein [Cellulomonas gilvus]AEI12935.1 extracellular solute-binding protein family 1 [Cellulomonas gilvus ATCC 13127]
MRKTLFRAATVVAAMSLLAACGGGDEAPAETQEPTTAETSAAPAGATGSLTIWVDENRKPAVQAAVDIYNETNPDVKVELVQKNFEDIRADFLAQVPTGEGPDITIGAHDWLGSFIVNGVAEPVDLGAKAGEFEAVATQAFTYDGQMYGLPYALETIAVVRNAALVDSTPETWDEMIAAGKEAGTKYPFVINTNGTTGDAYTYYGLQTSFGAPVFVQNEDGSYTSELGMGGDEGFAFADFLAENGMKGEGHFSTDWTYDVANQEFSDGNAPYTIAGPWAIQTFKDAGIDVAVDPIPSAGGETAAPFVGVQGFYLSAQSESKLIANDFLVNYVATPEVIKALYDADPRLPAMTSVADEVASDPIVAGFLSASKNGAPMPSIPEMGNVWEHWNAAEASIISGSAKPKDAWTKMLADLESAIG